MVFLPITFFVVSVGLTTTVYVPSPPLWIASVSTSISTLLINVVLFLVKVSFPSEIERRFLMSCFVIVFAVKEPILISSIVHVFKSRATTVAFSAVVYTIP